MAVPGSANSTPGISYSPDNNPQQRALLEAAEHREPQAFCKSMIGALNAPTLSPHLPLVGGSIDGESTNKLFQEYLFTSCGKRLIQFNSFGVML
jgi:hypothetical protein